LLSPSPFEDSYLAVKCLGSKIGNELAAPKGGFLRPVEWVKRPIADY